MGVACRSRQSAFVVGVDRRFRVMGITPDECRVVGCIFPQSFEMALRVIGQNKGL